MAPSPAKVARDALRPVKKTFKERQSSWRVTCDDTFIECFGELILYSALLMLVCCAGLCYLRRRRPYGNYRIVAMDSPHRDALVEAEEGWSSGGVVDRENFGSQNALHTLDQDNDGEGISLDDYAPSLSTVSSWVKDVEATVKTVVPEMNDLKAAAHMAAMNVQVAVSKAPATPERIAAVAGLPARVVELPPALESEVIENEPPPSGPPAPSRPHSSLHRVTLSWRGTLANGEAPSDAPTGAPLVADSPHEEPLQVEPMLDAFLVAVSVCENFGSLMAPAVKNDKSNFEKIRTAWAGLGQPTTLRSLLLAEVATKIHKPGGALKDPSAAIALVWSRRSFAFQTALLAGLSEDPSASLSAVATSAYKEHLEPHHNWVLKSTFKMALNAMPKMDEFLSRLGVGVAGVDREAVYADMAELVQVQQRVVDAIGALLVDLGLEKIQIAEKKAK